MTRQSCTLKVSSIINEFVSKQHDLRTENEHWRKSPAIERLKEYCIVLRAAKNLPERKKKSFSMLFRKHYMKMGEGKKKLKMHS